MNYSVNLLKLLGINVAAEVIRQKNSPEQRLFQAVVLQAFEDAMTTQGTKQDSYLKKEAHDWLLEGNKSFEYICWNAGFDPDVISSKYARLVSDGKIVFTELQKSWVKYRGLYKDYRSAKTSSERKKIMEKITEVNLKR